MRLTSLLQDMGIDADVRLVTDATTGKAIAPRSGIGKVWHIVTRELWIQDEVLRGRLIIIKLKNLLNTSDVLIEYLDKRTLDEAVAQLVHHYANGSSPAAPSFSQLDE